jgi:hypothetical protein
MEKARRTRNIVTASLIVSTIAILISIGAVVTGYIDFTPPENPCIMNSPLDVVSGEIRPPWSGLFNSTPQTYYLWYRGKWKLTEGACKTRRCVTEKEYERRIYGH